MGRPATIWCRWCGSVGNGLLVDVGGWCENCGGGTEPLDRTYPHEPWLRKKLAVKPEKSKRVGAGFYQEETSYD